MKVLVALLSIWVCLAKAQEYEFPEGFLFGVATASYQIEGAWNVSGKGESIWDTVAHMVPSVIIDGSTGDVACDAYSHVKEDVQLLNDLGVNFYRFSISWPRILPNGKADYINPDGIRYYNELLDELVANNLIPVATIYHYDLPQALQDQGGFLNETLVDYFEDYARVLFENFGDRVQYWITFNEPSPICENGYSGGSMAPLIYQPGVGGYICGRTLLLAHARAFHLYNNNYRDIYQGRIGITLNNFWYSPSSDSAEDIEAAELAMQVSFGWFAHPIYSEEGDYPQVMKERIAALSEEEGFATSRLPEFSQDEVEFIRGSSDFFALNHYTTHLCSALPEDFDSRPSETADIGAVCAPDVNAELATSSWLAVEPWGFREMLVWIKNEYNNPEIHITENGYSDPGNILDDCRRINYHNSYLTALLEAIYEDGCNVVGYTAWSFMDNFEWRLGYLEKFGFYSVDFNDPARPRTPKMSAHIYRNIIETRKIDWSYTPEGFEECEW